MRCSQLLLGTTYTGVIARSEATKQSMVQRDARWIASLALAMTGESYLKGGLMHCSQPSLGTTYTGVIARSEATKQSMVQRAARWIASLALAMTGESWWLLHLNRAA